MQIEEILIIKNAQEYYGISTEDINQISRVPSLMPLPLRPIGTRGLCSVGGSIVSMVDMNLLLGMGEVELMAHQSRLLSLNHRYASNALLVSEVYNTVEIDRKKIDYVEKKDDPVIAIYKYEDFLIQIISLEVLFSKINKVKIEGKEIRAGKVKNELVKEEEHIRFLIFSMSDEKYALNIDYLQEIILADTSFTSIAGTSKEVMGLITLRNEILTVVDLRTYYGFKAHKADSNRILIISYDGKKIGLYIDSIVDIKNFNKKDIEYMDDGFEDNKIVGVIHDNKSLISFFDYKVLLNIFQSNDAYIDSHSTIETTENVNEAEYEVIVFKLASKEYAFDVKCVDEIIDIVKATKVAFTDETIEGIINIRGQIVTIVSLFKKLNIDTVINEDSKIIVCNINNTRIGFVVDSVTDILAIHHDEIREDADALFDKVLHLDHGKRLVLSMDINKIVASRS
jgi:purine-binding chemotaxis protein CheW